MNLCNFVKCVLFGKVYSDTINLCHFVKCVLFRKVYSDTINLCHFVKCVLFRKVYSDTINLCNFVECVLFGVKMIIFVCSNIYVIAGWPQVMEILEVMEKSWNFIWSGKSHRKQGFFEKVMQKSWNFNTFRQSYCRKLFVCL